MMTWCACYNACVRQALVIAIASLGLTGAAHAGNGTLHATADGSVAATDNVFGAPAGSAQGDMLFDLRPGAFYAYDSPRMIDDLDASVELLEYAVNSDQPSFLFNAGWQGLFLPGPRSAVTLSASGGTGKANALATRTSPDQGTIGVLPSGAVSTQDGNASEAATWDATQSARLLQSAFARYTGTDDNLAMPSTTSSTEIGGSLGVERTLGANALALTFGAAYERLGRISPMGALLPSALIQQVNPTARASWRHDIDRHWSFALDGGVVYVHAIAKDPYNPTAKQQDTLFPAAGALVAYTQAWGRATFSINHNVAPDPLLAQNTVDTMALAQVSMPLPWLDSSLRSPKLVALGTVGFDQTELLDQATNKSNGTFDIAHVDLGVNWTPEVGRTFGVRYQLLYQHGNASATMVTPSFISNTLFATFSLMLPGTQNEQIPKLLKSVRADRSDLGPVGAEPVVPDQTVPGQ